MFAVTNVDDLVLLAVYFARAGNDRGAAARVVAGQYAGFAGILAVAIAGAVGVRLLPDAALPWFGVLPVALGLRAARNVWRERHAPAEAGTDGRADGSAAPGALAGRHLASRRTVAAALARWGHVVLPVVLIGVGVLILSRATGA